MDSVTAFETIINAQRQRIDDLEALLKAQTQISQHLHEECRKLEIERDKALEDYKKGQS